MLFLWLKAYTNHGEAIKVPDVSRMTYEQAAEVLEKEGLRIEFNDSLFNAEFEPYTVVSQVPPAGDNVKRGRKVYVLINTGSVPLVRVPQLVNPDKAIALRLAQSMLRSAGLNAGKIHYLHEAQSGDNFFVVAMYHKGKRILAGQQVPLGSTIDLKVSDDIEDISIMQAMIDPSVPAEINIPDLSGNTLDEARIVLELMRLRIGKIEFGSSVQDSASAIVIDQNPPAGGDPVMPGSKIDLKLE